MKNISIKLTVLLISGCALITQLSFSKTSQKGWEGEITIADSSLGINSPKAFQGGEPSLPALVAPEPAAIPSTAELGETMLMTQSAPSMGAGALVSSEIDELAAALEHDPVKIYEYVRNNIEYDCRYGWMRSPERTIVDQMGTTPDQAVLLFELLQVSGFSPEYEYGHVQVPVSGNDGYNLENWLGTVGYTASRDWIKSGGYYYYDDSPSYEKVIILHYWVKVTIDSVEYRLDPSFKPQPYTSAEDVLNLAGYDRTNLLSNAGGTANTNEVSDLDETSLRSYLDQLAQTLSENAVDSFPNGDAFDLIGGRTITAGYGLETLRVFTPYSTVTTNIMVAPKHYVNFDDAPFLPWISTEEVGTQKLTAQIASDGVTGTLLYDDSIKYIGTLSGGGSATVEYIKPDFYWNGSTWVFFWEKATKGYSFPANSANAFPLRLGNNRHIGMLKQHSATLSKSIADGASSDSILRSSLHVMGDSWMAQNLLIRNINERSFDGLISSHYSMGAFTGTTNSYSINIPHNFQSVTVNSTLAAGLAGARAPVFLASALEHGVIEQMQPETGDAVSTIELLTLASRTTNRIFRATSDNYGYVSNQLVNYSPAQLQSIYDDIYTDSEVMILPEDGEIGLNDWTGLGYIVAAAADAGKTDIGFIISGGLNGGYNTTDGPFDPYDANSEVQNWYYDDFGNPHPLSPEPVDMVTGAYVLDHEDLSMDGPLGLTLSRHYSSQSRFSEKIMGYGWNHSFNMVAQRHSDAESMLGLRSMEDVVPIALAVAAMKDILEYEDSPKGWMSTVLIAKWAMDQLTGNAVSVYLGQKTMTFIEQPDGSFIPPPGMTVSLSETNGAYTMQERHGNTYEFNTNGLIETISDPDNNTLDFNYTGGTNLNYVESSFGPKFTFGYTGGLLASVTDNSTPSRSVSYEYDSSNNLTNFVDAESMDWGITYDSNHKIKTLVDPESITTIQNFYNSAGQVTNQISATSNPWNFYFTGARNVEEDPYGNQTAYYIDGQQRTWSVEKAGGTRNYTYQDGQNHVATTVNEAGVTNAFVYDVDHNLLVQTNSAGTSEQVVSAYGYDSAHHLRFVTNAVGTTEEVVTEYAYTGTHHVETITEAKGSAIERETDLDYWGTGLLKKQTEGNGKRVTDFTYDGNGNLDTVVSIDAGTIDYLYDIQGNMETMTVDGKTTTFSYNDRRQPTSILFEDSTSTSKTYRDNGLLEASTDANGKITRYYWTDAYKQAGISFPDTGSTTNLYDDMDRLTDIQDAEGNWTTLQLDAVGRATNSIGETTTVLAQYDVVGNVTNTVVDPAGLWLQSRFTYDAQNRMTANYKPIGHEEYQLDALGRTTNRVDAAFKDWKTEYDELGRMKKAYRPSENYEEYSYDDLGLRTQFLNAEGKPINFGVDAQGRVTSTTNAIIRITSIDYDDAGNLSQRTAADLAVTGYGYDNLNRLIAITNESIEVATFDHDNNGNVISIENDDASVSLGYNSMNRLSASTQTVGSATSIVGYLYDLNGNRTHVAYPGNTNAVYVYGDDNRLESVDLSAFGIAATFSFEYDGANRLTNTVYPNGVNSSFGYDDNGNVTSIKHGSFIDREIHRNTLGFKHTETINAGLKPTAPETGRRIKTHNDADQLTSEWVQQGTNEYTVSYNYSANGCLTSSVSSVASSAYAYDYDNRLQSADDITYIYEASGARIGRVDGTITNYFVIDYTDGLKRPLAEADSAGNITRYYVWAGMRLLAHIEDNGNVFYYHSDELGSTLALTDASGDDTDHFAYMPYGYANHSGSNNTPFQWLGGYGVYYDAGTDLHLTLHRAYSSKLKRFIQPDPLGIDGGVNIYAWANLNPLYFVDPYGLWTIRLGIQVSVNLGFAVNFNIGIAIGYSANNGVTAGVVGGVGGGVGLVGGSGGGFVEVTNADEVNDLRGGSIQAGGSLGEGVVVGGDYIVGLNNDGSVSYQGFELNAGLGLGMPIDLHLLGQLSTGIATDGKDEVQSWK